jgi:hypothetical protein
MVDERNRMPSRWWKALLILAWFGGHVGTLVGAGRFVRVDCGIYCNERAAISRDPSFMDP